MAPRKMPKQRAKERPYMKSKVTEEEQYQAKKLEAAKRFDVEKEAQRIFRRRRMLAQQKANLT